MMILGSLVLSLGFRKAAAKSPEPIFASPLFGARRPVPRSNPAPRSNATLPAAKQQRTLPAKAAAPARKSQPKAPENFAGPLMGYEPLPIVPELPEVKMSSATYPFENLDPIAMAGISGLTAPEAASEFPGMIPAAVAILNTEETADRSTQESATASAILPEAAPVTVAPAEFDVQPMGSNETEARPQIEEPVAEENSAREIILELEDYPKMILQERENEAVGAVENVGTDVLTYFGLPQQPFDVTPDPTYLYASPSHREALSALKDGIEHFRGFLVLAAEPGMGKTTLVHKLMEELADSARVVFLFQTQCSSRELLCFILNELEVDHSGMDVVAMHRALNQALLEEMLRGRRFVLIVDEAQNLSEPVLETIRLLSDFETTHSKLIQIVLSGQPQLAETLMRPSLVQLRQRVAVLSSLKALSATETAEYIEHRLRAAGWHDRIIFSSEALDQIAESSQGVPRSINNLCFNSLLKAFHSGLQYVDASVVREVAERLDIEQLMRPLQSTGNSREPAPPTQSISTSELARALAAALNGEGSSTGNGDLRNAAKQKPEVILTGNLTEKVRSQGWSKRHEYRIMVTLERDPVSGLPVADRYYCCSIYMDEPQAAALEPGKPVRIRIEQD